MRALVLHGHFYQPPRENPWTGLVENEPSARPDHDWNERIHRECYRANAFARIFDSFGQVSRIVNNYSYLSFNLGPTLLSWMQEHDQIAYLRVIEADQISQKANNGHGNAIAQGYNHAILSLCTDRDRRTQIRWGLADFRHRFKREAEALWLPETAANDATLAALVDEGLRFVILAPNQAEAVRASDDQPWVDVSNNTIDPGVAYRWVHPDGSGRELSVFFYDGPIARSIAFEGVLNSSQAFIGRLSQGAVGEGRLVHIATDGESYGHHTLHGERALAHALLHEAELAGFRVTNYAAYLDDHRPTTEVRVKPGPEGEGTAWSCAHGVGRWTRDCGCENGARQGWNQAWRGPLRAALDLVRDEATRAFEAARDHLFVDPWVARDRYIELILDPKKDKAEWLLEVAPRALDVNERERALCLLEIQRFCQLMYTSCGWFFADISGIETVQVLKYVGRALDLMEDLGLESPRAAFMEAIGAARSNVPEWGSGAEVFERFVDPLRTTPSRVAAHLAISGLVEGLAEEQFLAGFQVRRSHTQRQRQGRVVRWTGRVELEELATGRRYDFGVASMHFGGVDFYCALRPYPGTERFQASAAKFWSNLRTASLPVLLRMAQQEFGPEEHGLQSVFPDGLQHISRLVFGDVVSRFAGEYVHLYETNERILAMLSEAGFELPPALRAAAEFTFSRRFDEAMGRAGGSKDPKAYEDAVAIAVEAEQRGYVFERAEAGLAFGALVAEGVAGAVAEPSPERSRAVTRLAQVGDLLGIAGQLGRAQELLYAAIESGIQLDDDVRDLSRALSLSIKEAS
ncbi:MAG: DUF3536 domain-containing protein [Vicinamibacteria bacterium]